MAKVVLAVDSDDNDRDQLVRCFAGTEIRVREAANGLSALKIIRGQEPPDLVVTEMLLPDLTGVALCRQIRESDDVPPVGVVMVSRYDAEMDRVIAFEAGVDDFVGKPFSSAEMLARTRAILRRPVSATPRKSPTGTPELRAGEPDIERFPGLAQATQRERQIFAELVRQSGRVVSRELLLRRLWPPSSQCTPRTVDAHIKSLRRKLGEHRDTIRTVRGLGYRYDSDGALPRS